MNGYELWVILARKSWVVFVSYGGIEFVSLNDISVEFLDCPDVVYFVM